MTRYWPGVIATALTATVTVMPGFAVGAFAVAIVPDLQVSRTGLGVAMSAFYAATALGSPFAKRLAVRLPMPHVLAAASLASSAVLLLLSRAAGLPEMITVLVAGGLANSLVQPAAGRFIAARTPARRRSLAAGIVGAALGAATLPPGLLVALVVPSYGWRAAALGAALIALAPLPLARFAALPMAPRVEPSEPAAGGWARSPRRVLVLWAVAASLSAAGNNAVASYFVPLGGHAGLAPAVAGQLLTLCAAFAIAVRIIAGALTDRAPGRNPLVIAAMMTAGGLGIAVIAAGTPFAFVAGAVLAFSAGWGWTGLLLAATLRLVPDRPENAGHTVQTGIYVGATAAPFGFSALATATGFSVAALLTSIAGVLAAGLVLAGHATSPSRSPGPASMASALRDQECGDAEPRKPATSGPQGCRSGRPVVTGNGAGQAAGQSPCDLHAHQPTDHRSTRTTQTGSSRDPGCQGARFIVVAVKGVECARCPDQPEQEW